MATRELKATVFYNAGELTYNFPFDYIKKRFVSIKYIDNFEADTLDAAENLEYGVDYTINDKVVTLKEAGDTSKYIYIYRSTPTEPLVDFSDSSFLTEENLDLSNLQQLHLNEEMSDYLILHKVPSGTLEEIRDAVESANQSSQNAQQSAEDALEAAQNANANAQSINIRTFPNVESMKQANNLKAGGFISTQGFYQPNDGGGADYIVISELGESVVDEASIIALKNSLYAKLLIKDYIDVKWFGAKCNGIDDDTPFVQKAIDYCIRNKIKEVRGNVIYVGSPIYIDNVQNNGLYIKLNEVYVLDNFEAYTDWKTANTIFNIGSKTAGAMINVNAKITYVDAKNKCDVIHNNCLGCATWEVETAKNYNIFYKVQNPTYNTASMLLKGNWLSNGNLAFYLEATTGAITEGTSINYQFINHNLYGGIILKNGSQYCNVYSQLDFNGRELQELWIDNTEGFSVGQTIQGNSGGSGEILGVYDSKLLVIKQEAFTETETINGTKINFIKNAGDNNFYFDIINLVEQSFSKNTITAPYLGGITGNNTCINSDVIFYGNANDAFCMNLAGIAIASGAGSTVIKSMVNNQDLLVHEYSNDLTTLYPELNVRQGLYTDRTTVALVSGTVTEILDFNGLTGAYLVTLYQEADVNLSGCAIVITNGIGINLFKLGVKNLDLSTSGTKLTCLHNTGGTKPVRVITLRMY